jgi:hypothetical protein
MNTCEKIFITWREISPPYFLFRRNNLEKSSYNYTSLLSSPLTDNAQKEQLIRIFEELITQLKEEMADASAQNFAPIVESG